MGASRSKSCICVRATNGKIHGKRIATAWDQVRALLTTGSTSRRLRRCGAERSGSSAPKVDFEKSHWLHVPADWARLGTAYRCVGASMPAFKSVFGTKRSQLEGGLRRQPR
eukprot:6176920-Pleurochrysis_carterae.AAC.4